jgi:O-antigen/teichoic acid export membrane protein
MQDTDFNIIATRSVKGVFALISRTFMIQVLTIIANFVLTIYLDPASFGVFFLVSSIVVFLNYFQDIGLAAALIQKKEEPTVEELRTTFTAQQALVLIVIIPTLIFSKNIASFYHLNTAGYYLFLMLIFSFFLSSLRTIPTVILERKLDFTRLVIPQIAESVAYNGALIVFAILGFKITSFTIAVTLQGIVGLIFIYAIQPWPIGLSFHKETFKKLISYGLPFQANSILALIKDDLLTVYLGKVLPFAQVGFIGFAQGWAYMPLRLVMDNVIKITFPSMARLQHDHKALRIAIEKSLFLIAFFIFPIAVGFATLAPFITLIIPKYAKWEPALIALAFYSLSTIFSSISTPLTNFLNAIGKVKITLYFMIMWTVLTWVLTPLFIFLYGFNGVAAASFLISLTSILVLIVARRYVEFSMIRPILPQFIAGLAMFGYIELSKGFVHSLPVLILEILVAGVIYIAILFIIAHNECMKTFKFVLSSIRDKEK